LRLLEDIVTMFETCVRSV